MWQVGAGTADVCWGCTQTGTVLTLVTQTGPWYVSYPFLFSRTPLGLCWATEPRACHFVVVSASELAPVILWPFPASPRGGKIPARPQASKSSASAQASNLSHS